MSLQTAFVGSDQAADLDRAMEVTLLYGIYTGIVSITLWNILAVFSIYSNELSRTDSNKSRSIGRAMVAIIILLYITTAINFFLNGPFLTIEVLPDFPIILDSTWRRSSIANMGIGATAVMSTVAADCTIIWRCWMVWGRRWLIVLVPILCLLGGCGFKILETTIADFDEGEDLWCTVSYLSCILATTLWCTILIVLRIVTVIRANNGADNRLREYRHVIEVLVESSALHSVVLIIYVALKVTDNWLYGYFDALAAFTTGIAPTLLAGRIAAGHARPDNSWQGSIISSLRFEAHPQADAEICSQDKSMVDDDLEAQSNQVDEAKETGTEKRI